MERPRIPNYDKEKTFDWDYVFKLNRYIEHLEQLVKIYQLSKESKKETVFCKCIDRCSSKRNNYFCIAKRKCKEKLKL